MKYLLDRFDFYLNFSYAAIIYLLNKKLDTVFGKTVECVYKHRNIKLLFSSEAFEREIRNPLFRSGHVYSDYLAAAELNRSTVTMNKPRFVGISVLSLAKEMMYWYHYEKLSKLFPENRLLFTDTGTTLFFTLIYSQTT